MAPGPSVSGRDWRERESSSQRQNQLSREELRLASLGSAGQAALVSDWQEPRESRGQYMCCRGGTWKALRFECHLVSPSTASHYDNGHNTMSVTHAGAAERICEPDSGQVWRGLPEPSQSPVSCELGRIHRQGPSRIIGRCSSLEVVLLTCPQAIPCLDEPCTRLFSIQVQKRSASEDQIGISRPPASPFGGQRQLQTQLCFSKDTFSGLVPCLVLLEASLCWMQREENPKVPTSAQSERRGEA